jgi:hypothetical protein
VFEMSEDKKTLTIPDQPIIYGKPRQKKKSFSEIAEKMQFDAVQDLINIARDEATPLNTKVTILSDLAGYQYPKLRSVEISGNDESPLNVTYQGDLLELLKYRNKDG